MTLLFSLTPSFWKGSTIDWTQREAKRPVSQSKEQMAKGGKKDLEEEMEDIWHIP